MDGKNLTTNFNIFYWKQLKRKGVYLFPFGYFNQIQIPVRRRVLKKKKIQRIEAFSLKYLHTFFLYTSTSFSFKKFIKYFQIGLKDNFGAAV